MLKMVKTIAKALKGIVRPKSTKMQVAIPQRDTVHTPAKVANIPALVPTREELTARLVQSLQAEVNTKVKAFLDAVENYPARWQLDEWLDDDGTVDIVPDEVGADLVCSLEALGFGNENWLCGGYEYNALCAAIEYYQQNGKRITVELVADVVEAIDDNEYVFFPDVESDEDLGCALTDEFLQNTDAGWKVGWLIQAVDWKRLGEDWRNEEGGCFTSRGYFQFGRLEF